MTGWGLALVALLGCSQPPEEPVAVEEPEAPAEDPVILVGDVQHLLSEAVAQHGARQLLEAERAWRGAYATFQRDLLPRIRAEDPDHALALEYAFGRLGDDLRRSRSRPAVRLRDLDADLAEIAAAWREASATP